MDIKDLLNPANLRALVVYLSIYLIGRSIYYLVIGDPLAYFEQQRYQEVFEQTLGLKIPMVILTILWPLILGFVNVLHADLRLAPTLFYTVIALHVTSCLIAAAMLYSFGWETMIFANSIDVPPNLVITSVTVGTIVSGAVAVALYRWRFQLFETTQ